MHGTREDVVLLINGIPVLLIECKNASKDEALALGIDQIRRYHNETPEVMVPQMVFTATEAIGFAYGVTWNTIRRNIFRWKHEEIGNLEAKVKSFCAVPHLLRLLKDFILFAEKEEELQKLILRQHQAVAVDRVVERALDAKLVRGLVWHTQGSGKTYTMIKAAELLGVNCNELCHRLLQAKDKENATGLAQLLSKLYRDADLIGQKYCPNLNFNDELHVVWCYTSFGALWREKSVTSGPRFSSCSKNVRSIADENLLLKGIIDRVDFNATTHGVRDLADDRLSNLIERISEKRLGLDDVEPDIIGRSYEYLIRKFAEGSVSSAGEFYTPKEVGLVMARIVNPEPGMEIYDPCCGSAGLLIKCNLVLQEKLAKAGKNDARLYASTVRNTFPKHGRWPT